MGAPRAQVAYVGFDSFGASEQEPVMIETPFGYVAIQQDGAQEHRAQQHTRTTESLSLSPRSAGSARTCLGGRDVLELTAALSDGRLTLPADNDAVADDACEEARVLKSMEDTARIYRIPHINAPAGEFQWPPGCEGGGS